MCPPDENFRPPDQQRADRVAALTAENAALRDRVAALEGNARRLKAAWERLCQCTDEFEPNDMTACSEATDELDNAILEVIKDV
jgi:predicted nuclease with TOPRIM domain